MKNEENEIIAEFSESIDDDKGRMWICFLVGVFACVFLPICFFLKSKASWLFVSSMVVSLFNILLILNKNKCLINLFSERAKEDVRFIEINLTKAFLYDKLSTIGFHISLAAILVGTVTMLFI